MPRSKPQAMTLMDEETLDRLAGIIPGGAADMARAELARRRAQNEDVYPFLVESNNTILVGPKPDQSDV